MSRNRYSHIAWAGKMLTVLFIFASCTHPKVPESYGEVGVKPKIYPDYTDVTIPVNIAPLCFELITPADAAVTRFTAGGRELTVEGRKCRPDADEWRSLLSHSVGTDIAVEVFAAKDGRWVRFSPYTLHVSPDSIDSYLCYRLISPSYVSYEELTINQRCLENFDERVVADNMLCSSESGGQCVNCHSFQRNTPARMQLHARQSFGGTVIAYDGELKKVNPGGAGNKLPAVYPAWHPTERLIAYSTNSTMQAFHTADIDKIEVYDSQSSLLLYDIDTDKLLTVDSQQDELETYPAWSPDGRWLYYCSAHFEYAGGSVDAEEITLRTRELKYNIWRRPFNSDTRSLGPRQLVFAADSLGVSAAHPRISPDGRWLLFSQSEYGTFHIWHRDADLWLIDLKDKDFAARPLSECNSPAADSYHCWSSTGRWIVFSSRRHDGVFTRPFFAHIDESGKGEKPFELPSADPDLHRQLLKSYNVPEFTCGSISLTPQQIAGVLKSGAE